jgi:hypothetical protein
MVSKKQNDIIVLPASVEPPCTQQYILITYLKTQSTQKNNPI